jgi:hypothetical protein
LLEGIVEGISDGKVLGFEDGTSLGVRDGLLDTEGDCDGELDGERVEVLATQASVGGMLMSSQ